MNNLELHYCVLRGICQGQQRINKVRQMTH